MRFKSTVILSISLILLTTTCLRSSYAIDKSRASICLLFFSGLGSSVAGTIMQSQANETYDKYLHTAVQADMDKFIDEYENKNNQSIIARRAGLGIVMGAILLSLVDAANIPQPEIQRTPSLFGFKLKATNEQIFTTRIQEGKLILALDVSF